MSNFQSISWLSKINSQQNSTDSSVASDIINKPVFPSIAHPLHPALRQLMENIGTPKTLNSGEFIFKYGEPIHSVVLVKQGITARQVGQSPDNIMAVSIPGRIACGNLNFFTSFPCVGSYYALVPSEVITVEKELLKKIFFKEPELFWFFCQNAELATLSDRMAFAVLSMLSVEERVKSFYLAWAVNYGIYEPEQNGEGWIKMLSVLQRKYLCYITKASKYSLDSVLKFWKASERLLWKDNLIWVRPSLLQSSYNWMMHLEEGSDYKRPADLLVLFR